MQRLRNAMWPLLLAGIVAVGWSIGSVSATDVPDATGERAATAELRGGADPYFLSGPMTVVRTYLSRGLNGQGMAAATFTPAEAPVTIRCPGQTGTCVVAADINIAISSTNTNIELCPYVDGDASKSQLDCPANVGASNASAGYHSYNFIHTFKISHGTHTVRAYALAGGGGTMSYFSNVYTVYKKTA